MHCHYERSEAIQMPWVRVRIAPAICLATPHLERKNPRLGRFDLGEKPLDPRFEFVRGIIDVAARAQNPLSSG
jgi:hypothetical protein